jgi:hypothetical protein
MENTTRIELEKALAKGIITQAQFEALVAGLSESENNSIVKTPAPVNPTYQISLNILLCFFIITLIVFIGGAFHFVLDYFVGKPAIFATPILCLILFTISGNYFWNKNLKIYANIFYIASFSIIPYVFAGEITQVFYELVYRISYSRNYLEFSWVYIITTLVTVLGGLAYWYFRRSLLLMVPIVFNAWLFSMAILPVLLGQFRRTSSEEYLGVTLCFGLAFIVFSVCQEKKNTQKYLGWLYVFGCFVFYANLHLFMISHQHSQHSSECCILLGVFLVGIGIVYKRRLFTILAWVYLLPYLFRVLAILFYGFLSVPPQDYKKILVFSNSLVFSVPAFFLLVSAILIYVLYDKKPEILEKILPVPIKKMLPKYRRKDDSND